MATLPDYSINVAQPFTEALKGYQLGMGFEAAKQQNILQQQQAQQALQQQKTLQDAQRLVIQNPNAENYSRLMTLDPKSSEGYQRAWSARNSQQQETLAADLLKQGAAITSGKPEIATQYLEDQAIAIEAKNNGQPTPESQAVRTQARIMKEHPQFALGQIQALLALNPLGKQAAETLAKFGEERRSEAQAPAELRQKLAVADKAESDLKTALETAKNAPERAAAEAALAKAQADKAKVEAQFAGPLAQASLNLNTAQIKNINSEIGNRAAKLNLDRQTMQATVAEKLSSIQKNVNELPADTRKLVNESAVTAAAAKQSAGQFNDLAKQLEAAGGGYGVFSSASEFLKKGTGFQGGLTQLRNEYTRLRNSAAIKSLPPGPATDADIQLALKPFPPETADAKTMASFLRGMAKLQDIEASVSNAKTDWLAGNNGVLTRAKNTFQAGDYATKAGESFNDFTQRVVQDVSKRYDPTQQTSLAQQIPTDRNPRPAAAQNNIRSQADAILSGGR